VVPLSFPAVKERESCYTGNGMAEPTEVFYDDLADSYHLLFDDWNQSIARQAGILGPLLERYTGKTAPYILDCACGIGTQALGLAMRGHTVVASDFSYRAVERARRETTQRDLNISFHQADMRNLSAIPESGFDAVLVADNALPHLLSRSDLEQALAEMAKKLTPAGVLVATLRDYDSLISTRPSTQQPAFYGQEVNQRILHQVWKWRGSEYDMHLYITLKTKAGWEVKHFTTTYRALLRTHLNEALEAAGFAKTVWLDSRTTSFYQPAVIAGKQEI
jgi:glycine/sarcosine N-methyltransferase